VYYRYMNMKSDSADGSKSSEGSKGQLAVSSLLDSIRAIAQEGLSYSQDKFDIARYEKLLKIVSREYSPMTGIPEGEIRQLFLKEQGCITPKLGVDCLVMNSEGKTLVLQRDDGTWSMPGGWADVGESPYETAIRETLEESGLDVTPLGYGAIAYKTPETHPGFTSQVNIGVVAELSDESQAIELSHEHLDYKWIFDVVEIDNWHPGQKRLIPVLLDVYRQKRFIPSVD
jgi:8-oxo-dGTP pyrophosphatase MutT (NUDIX family)